MELWRYCTFSLFYQIFSEAVKLQIIPVITDKCNITLMVNKIKFDSNSYVIGTKYLCTYVLYS